MNVGFKIKKIRELRNYTQQYVAENIGVSQAYYNLIENNKARLDIQRLYLISETLDFDLSSFWNCDPLNVLQEIENEKNLEINSKVVGEKRILDHLLLLEKQLLILKKLLVKSD